jgi:hypothetical protein
LNTNLRVATVAVAQNAIDKYKEAGLNGATNTAQLLQWARDAINVVPAPSPDNSTLNSNLNAAIAAVNAALSLSAVNPAGTLPYGTGTTKLSVTTNKYATCKYDTVNNNSLAGVPFANMRYTFASTGSGKNLHEQPVTVSNGAMYNYYVKCQDLSNGAITPLDSHVVFSVSASTTDTQAPTVPANLTATALSDTQVRLQWSASTDNVAGTIQYRIYRNNVYVTNVTTLTYTNTGLTGNTSYSYKILAWDAAKNISLFTVPVVIKTLVPVNNVVNNN